jgi:hypothetical protein
VEWALLGLAILFLVITYIVVQGTRAAMAWRKAAAEGDVKVIRQIVQDSLSAWSSMKRPKEVPIEVWRGIQSLEIVEVEADFVRVSAQAESEYRMVDGQWVEVRNPLEEGMAITARAAEMLFYELPHFRPQRLQIDVYTSFREANGAALRRCILSMESDRQTARNVDWDEWSAEEIVDALGARYRLGEGGRPLPIEVREPKTEEPAEARNPSARSVR